MIDTLLTFILGYTLTLPFLILTCLWCLWCERREAQGWAIVMASIAALVAYNIFELPLLYFGWFAAVYIPIGVVWSLWRWRQHCAAVLLKFYAIDEPSKGEKLWALEDVDAANQKTRIAAWVISWPWALFVNALDDFIGMIEVLTSKFLRGVYDKISSNARSQIETAPSILEK